MGAGDDTSPAAAGVRRYVPAELERARLRVRLVVERADRLRRVRERLIGRVHEHAREQHGGRDPRIERGEGALEQVADLPLCHRDQGVQWERCRLVFAERVLQQQRADVRAVAVREHDLVALGAQREHGGGDLAHVGQLLLPGAGLAGLDDGVAADRDDHPHGLTLLEIRWIRPARFLSYTRRKAKWKAARSAPANRPPCHSSIFGYTLRAALRVDPGRGEQWRSQT